MARSLRLATLIALALPLLSFAVLGWFSRYAADDYCTAAQVAVAGVVQAQSNLYANWSGRFAATLFNTLLEVVGISVVPLLTSIALLGWVAAAAWTARELAYAFGWRLDVLSATLLSALLVYATLLTTADMPQNLYWQTGLVTYLLPLILATLYLGWVATCGLRQKTAIGGPARFGICFGLALLAGGTSETFAAAQVAALGLASIAALPSGGRPRNMLLAGLVGAVLALGIIALAPGNEVRQATTARAALPTAVSQTLEFTRGWLRLTFARPHAAELGLLIGIPAMLGALTPRASASASAAAARGRWLRSAVVLPAIFASVLVVILACMLPAFYALDSNPPGRAQLIPEYVLLATVALTGWCAGAALAQPIAHVARNRLFGAATAVALLALLVLGPIRNARASLAELEAARAYAANWDRVDQQVRADRAQGVDAVTVPPLPSIGTVQNLDFVGPDRTDWFNECVAGYYGVSSIAASPGG